MITPYFGATSPWRRRFDADDVELDTSDAYQTLIEGATNGVTHNRNGFTPALLTAAADAPRQTLSLAGSSGWSLVDVPIPPELYDAADYFDTQSDTDSAFSIHDEETGYYYNLFGVDYSGETVSAYTGAIFAPDGTGWWDNRIVYAGRASGGAFSGGMIRAAEMSDGEINHALAISLPPAIIRSSGYVSPATATDGSGDSSKIPMGQRFRLDPTLTDAQLDALGLVTASDLIVARALQNYGAYLVDSAATFALYYESGLGSGATLYPVTNPWPEAIVAYLQAMPAPPVPVFDTPSTTGDVVEA